MEEQRETEQAGEEVEKSPEPLLRVEHLTKTYALPNGRLRVLEDVHLEVQKGEFIAITGQSGSGRQQVGFVFQLYYLLPNLTALENVMAPLLPYRRKLGFDLRQRAGELLESVGLGDRLGHPPARLSGGEQQRVAIARALINHPKVVLADEPTGNLDPATGLEVLEVLRALQRSGNQTLVMVTHDPELAALADRRVHLEQLRRVET